MSADTEYDYVVVGGGSAGCVLAGRLTEDPDVTVVLVEAGPHDTAEAIRVPAQVTTLFKGALDWDYDSDPEPGLGRRRIYLPRGRVLGGCSSINVMIYIRGNRADYDEWAADGASGWSYDEVLPYFLRSEDNERGAGPFHGAGGPLSVIDGRSNHLLAGAVVAAAIELGYASNDDFNGADQFGFGRYQVTQRDGLRCSAADAFLRPAAGRPNLNVLTDALAHRLLWDGRRATGVEFSRGPRLERVRARREVLVAAGAFGSPALLLRSGVGPADQLGAHGIPVIADLPVGENLQDHLLVMVNYLTNEESLRPIPSPENLRLLRLGRGPLTSNLGESGGFLATRPELTVPDVQFQCAPALFFGEGLGVPPADGLSFGPNLLKPTSRGSVTLRSAGADVAPRIVHNHLQTEQDRRTILDGVRVALEMSRQPALMRLIAEPFSAPEGDSDAELLAFVRVNAHTLFHPTSTCAIGSVVAPDLRVRGADGLRVIDASIMPSVVRGNTNAPVIMIAERAVDFLRAG